MHTPVTIEAKQLVQDYLDALSGHPKPEELFGPVSQGPRPETAYPVS